MHAVWQRVRLDAVGQILPVPVCPPAVRVVCLVSFRRSEPTALFDGARPHTLRAHAQSRWRSLPGWA